jgi:uncharacterized membrane protein YfcA
MISWWLYPLLFLTGLAAGFIDSIAGGGGLITLPVLLNIGLAPQDALGTNKLQAAFGSGSAAWHYGRARLIEWDECVAGVAFTFVGAYVGSMVVLRLDPSFLKRMIPWFLIAIALFSIFRPALGQADTRPHLTRRPFYVLFGLAIGFYDGFFGPGTGSFWALAFVLGLGFNFTRATAHTKLMNFTSNVASLLVFLWGGQVHYGAGVAMGAGQLLGARLGARVVIRRGARFIRPLFITVVLAITARLLWEDFVHDVKP